MCNCIYCKKIILPLDYIIINGEFFYKCPYCDEYISETDIDETIYFHEYIYNTHFTFDDTYSSLYRKREEENYEWL